MKSRKFIQAITAAMGVLAVPIAVFGHTQKRLIIYPSPRLAKSTYISAGRQHVWNDAMWCIRCGVPMELVVDIPAYAECGVLDRAVIEAFSRHKFAAAKINTTSIELIRNEDFWLVP